MTTMRKHDLITQIVANVPDIKRADANAVVFLLASLMSPMSKQARGLALTGEHFTFPGVFSIGPIYHDYTDKIRLAKGVFNWVQDFDHSPTVPGMAVNPPKAFYALVANLRPKLKRNTIKEMVREFFTIIFKALAEHTALTIRGVCKFKIFRARRFVNPKTRESVIRNSIRFYPVA